MKTNHLFTSMVAVSALFVTSCSTSKLAQTNAIEDDVYNTTAQAKVYKELPAPAEVIAQTDQQGDDYYGNNDQQGDDYYGTSDPYYDQDYATRINRFYYANPWRTYYDGYYGFSPFGFGFNQGFSPWGMGFGMDFGWNYSYFNQFSPFNNWGFYGAPYMNNFWGPYAYNNPFWGGGFYGGGFGGGFGGGGFIGNVGGSIRNNGNYGPRPTRGSENGINRRGTSYVGGNNGISDRVSSGGTRAERYNPTNGTATNGARTNGTATNSRPTRSNTDNSRPTRSNDAPTRTYSPPAQSSPPPSSSSSGSRGGGGSSSSGSSSSGGGRPTRGGGL